MEAKLTKQEPKEVMTNLFEDVEIEIKPIPRNRGGVYPIGHESNFLTERSYIDYSLPRSARTKQKVDPFNKLGDGKYERALTEKEKETIASYYAITVDKLNPNHKESFFNKYAVKLDRTVKFINLKNIEQFIEFRVLLANSDHISKSLAEAKDKQSYRYAIVFKDEEKKEKVLLIDEKRKAYKAYDELTMDKDKMYDFLLIYWFNNKGVLKPKASIDELSMRLEIGNIIEKNINGFLNIITDENKEEKMLIQKGILKGLIRKINNKYIFEGFSGNLIEFVSYLKNAMNNEDRLKLVALTNKM